jgi:hypothetical protein
MSPRSAIRTSRRRPALMAGALALATLAATPGPAAAKTFVASFKDSTGDSTSDARDIVSARVAYNRRSGALSASVKMNAALGDVREDAVVIVLVSDLVNGKCRKVRMTMGATLSDPSVPIAWPGSTHGKRQWNGTGSIDGDTISMRVKAKGLSGHTPGCTAIFVTSVGDVPTLLDDTPDNNGFA